MTRTDKQEAEDKKYEAGKKKNPARFSLKIVKNTKQWNSKYEMRYGL